MLLKANNELVRNFLDALAENNQLDLADILRNSGDCDLLHCLATSGGSRHFEVPRSNAAGARIEAPQKISENSLKSVL